MIRGTFKQPSASCLRFPTSVCQPSPQVISKIYTLAALRRFSVVGRGQPPIREMLVSAALHESGSGTFRKCRNVRLESGMRTKADVRQPL